MGRTTEGDCLTRSLAQSGGKDLFVKDLQQALLDEEADIAIHSFKDLSVQNKAGLIIAAFLLHEDPRDVLVTNEFNSLTDLLPQAIIGTSGPRRHCQLKRIQSKSKIGNILGNIETRLAKLNEGYYDTIILAAAGLKNDCS
nr:hypothetical protein [Candidatus Coxiella mudrowiae]